MKECCDEHAKKTKEDIYLVDVKGDDKLREMYEQSEASTKALQDRADFLIAQKKKLTEDISADKKGFWKEFEARLNELGHLSEYNKETDALSINNRGQIILKKNIQSGSGLAELFGSLLK